MTTISNQKDSLPRVVMTGCGHWFPENILDNQFFDYLNIESDANWIEERTGILERRSILTRAELTDLRHGRRTRKDLLDSGRIISFAEMSRKPWAINVERAGISPATSFSSVIGGTSVPDDDIPAHACTTAAALGIKTDNAFDVNSACGTFVVQLHAARGMIRGGVAQNIATFVAERYTTRVDYGDRKTCVLFGDSSVCSTLETWRPGIKGLELLDTLVHSMPEGNRHIRMPDGEFFAQDGQAVQKFAIQKTIAATEEILTRNSLTSADLSYFMGHQANLRMLSMVAHRLNLRPEQHLYNVDTRGNQGATGAPGVLSQNWELFKPGDLVVLAVVGAGLTWGSALFRTL